MEMEVAMEITLVMAKLVPMLMILMMVVDNVDGRVDCDRSSNDGEVGSGS